MSSEDVPASGDDRGGEDAPAGGGDRRGGSPCRRRARPRVGTERGVARGEARASARQRATRPSSARGRPRETSAGGVVLRGEPGCEQVLAIVPTRRAADGSSVLGLPKGHIDPGETPLQAATREVREETGIVAEPLGELGEVRYFYRRAGRTVPKSVLFFLFRYLSGKTSDHDHEVEDVRWIDLREAHAVLTYDGERDMVGLALDRVVAHRDAAADGRAQP
jgi:8-oxo-dGTP pyrophosphatase MutT (NUDIX family)